MNDIYKRIGFENHRSYFKSSKPWTNAKRNVENIFLCSQCTVTKRGLIKINGLKNTKGLHQQPITFFSSQAMKT